MHVYSDNLDTCMVHNVHISLILILNPDTCMMHVSMMHVTWCIMHDMYLPVCIYPWCRRNFVTNGWSNEQVDSRSRIMTIIIIIITITNNHHWHFWHDWIMRNPNINHFSYRIRRKTLYYMYNIVFPCMMMSTLTVQSIYKNIHLIFCCILIACILHRYIFRCLYSACRLTPAKRLLWASRWPSQQISSSC